MTPLLALIPVVERIFDRVLPDPEQKAKALLELKKEENQQALQEMQIEMQTNKMQADINTEEARHSSLFVSGARPFIMWTCGVAFAYHYVVLPFLAFFLSNYYGRMVLLPSVDMEVISYTLMGILGIGGSMRTYEKIRGVTK